MTGASLLHTFLPPWDWEPDFVTDGLKEFPFAQKIFFGFFHNRWYRLLVYSTGYIALNARSTIWRWISVKNAAGPNASVPTVVHAANVAINKANVAADEAHEATALANATTDVANAVIDEVKKDNGPR